MQFIEHQVGELIVSQRKNDGYINATKLTRAYELQTQIKRNPNSWFEKDRTHEFLNLLHNKTGIEIYDLVQKKGEGKDREIWIHPNLAISFAMWLSPEFEMMVSEWVQQWLLKGQTSTTSKPPILHPYQRVWYQRLMLFEQKTQLPKGYWCIFEEIGKLMRNLEANNVSLHDRATIDVSVGLAWCRWLREEKNYDTSTFEQYIHYYPDNRGERLANVYPYELLGTFHQWLEDTYIPEKFPKYVRDFLTAEECELISKALDCKIKPVNKRLEPSS